MVTVIIAPAGDPRALCRQEIQLLEFPLAHRLISGNRQDPLTAFTEGNVQYTSLWYYLSERGTFPV
jgi:hypothetical protein